MTVAPFVQMAEAQGKVHEYRVPVYNYQRYTCSECNSVIWAYVLDTTTEQRTHSNNTVDVTDSRYGGILDV